MAELPDVLALRTLEPPPGGLARLRERLASSPRRRRWWLVAVPAVIAAAVLAIVWFAQPAHRESSPEAAPATALRDREVAGDGTFYWVASTPGRRSSRTSRTPPPRVIAIDDVARVGDYAPP